METVDHDDRTTAYRDTGFGAGPTVCYVHGAGGRHDLWVNQYGDHGGPPAVALDLAGHGESEDVDVGASRPTLEAYADDVVAVCEAADATVLCGNSMGGAVALWVALERSLPLEALVLADSGAKLGVDPGVLEALDRNFEATVASLHAPDVLFHDPTEELLEVSKRALLSTGRAVTLRDFRTCDAFDARDRLGEISIPTLAICGAHDTLTPPAWSEYLAEELPNGEFAELPDAAHLPMLERPAAFGEALRSFLH